MTFGAAPRMRNPRSLVAKVVRTIWRLAGWPSFLRRLQWKSIHRFLELTQGLSIADIGAGPMQMSVELAKQGAIVTSVDIDLPPSAQYFSQQFDVSLLVADACSLPVMDSKFDRILLSSIIQMIPEPSRLLDETRRILKTDGILVASVPCHYRFIPVIIAKPFFQKLFGLPPTLDSFETALNKRFHVNGPFGYYTLEALSELLLSCGFEIIEVDRSPGLVGSLLWEMGVLTYFRFGSIVFHLLFLFYPLAYICDLIFPTEAGSELVIKAVPRNGF